MQYGPFIELGITELIGINEAIAQNQYTKSVSVTLDPGGEARSGTVGQLALITTEDDLGGIITPTGYVLIFDADPAISAGDATITAAEWLTVLGWFKVTGTDFTSDANGGFWFDNATPVDFHALTTLYISFFMSSATPFNDGGTDDEQMEFNLWWRPVK